MATIRKEKPSDIASIRRVNIKAFGREGEAELVDRLRDRGVLTVSLVAEEAGEVVGHIAFNPVDVTSESSSFRALTLAPLAVLPAYQNKGIGSQLVSAGLQECRRLGHNVIVVVGHPGFYPRFGFVRASSKGLECEFEAPDDVWMVAELEPDALAGRTGRVTFQPEFKDYV